jgi:hypothetical protein
MIARKSVVALLLLLGVSISLHAQKLSSEDYMEVRKRKLIVMIEEPREDVIKKLTKSSEQNSIDVYKGDLKALNENMRQVVAKFWSYNKADIQFKNIEEIKALSKTGTEEYVVLACVSTTPDNLYALKFNQGIDWSIDINKNQKVGDRSITAITISKIEDFGKRQVGTAALFDLLPSKASLVCGLRDIRCYDEPRKPTVDENGNPIPKTKWKPGQLSEKTLLIREEWLDEELTSENLKKYYPYPYEICTREFMDEVVMDLNSKYAYGVMKPEIHSSYKAPVRPGFSSGKPMFCGLIIDATDSFTLHQVCGLHSDFTIKDIQKIAEQSKAKDAKTKQSSTD